MSNQKDNDFFLIYKWNRLDKFIVLCSQHYERFIYGLILFFTLLTIFFYMLNISIAIDSPDISASLTIVGVIYPLVIGFIGVLFQKKLEKKAIFPIYRNYSGFMISGISGLVLAIFILLKKLVLDHYFFGDLKLLSSIDLSLGFWFVINLILTIRFFLSTFDIINDRSKDKLLYQYSLNESLRLGICKVKRNVNNDGIDSFEGVFDIYSAFLEMVKEDYKERRLSEFVESFQRLIEWYAQISDHANYLDDKNKNNIIFLQSFRKISTLHNQFLHEIFLFGVTVIQDSRNMTRYLNSIYYSMFKLALYKKNLSEEELLLFLQYHYFLNCELVEILPIDNRHNDELLKSLVENWENYIGMIGRTIPRTSDFGRLLSSNKFLLEHIKYTSLLIVLNNKIGNMLGVKWSIDLLLNWHSNVFMHENKDYRILSEHSSLFLEPLMLDDFSRAEQLIAFDNFLVDLRLILACYFIEYSNEINDKLLNTLLVDTKSIDDTGLTFRDTRFFFKVTDIFDSYMRQNSSDEYAHYLSNVLEMFTDVKGRQGVRGRMYISRVDTLSDLDRALVYLLIKFSRFKWRLSRRISSMLDANALSDQKLDEVLKDIERWKHLIKTINLDFAIDEYVLAIQMNNTLDSLSEIYALIQRYKNVRILSAAIDYDYLNKLRDFSSKEIMEYQQSSSFLSIFHSYMRVVPNKNQHNEKNIGYISNIERASIVVDIGSIYKNLVNEESFISNVIQEILEKSIQQDYLIFCKENANNYYLSTHNELLRYISGISRGMQSPIVLINIGHSLMRQLQDEKCFLYYKNQFDLEKAQIDDDWIYKIGSALVYAQQWSNEYCYLVEKNHLIGIEFERYDDEQIINIKYEEGASNPLVGSFLFLAKYEIKFQKTPRIENLKIQRP